jgi:hypothetical protein
MTQQLPGEILGRHNSGVGVEEQFLDGTAP